MKDSINATKLKKRILTGDRPTGPLHIGHYIGSIKKRIELQDEYESFFIIADLQVFTDHIEKYAEIQNNIYELMADYMALGLKPSNCFFVQSCVPELAELTVYFSYLVGMSNLIGNPTVKQEAKVYGVKNMSFGFVGYPISQAADILGFRPQLVPVGKDQLPHLELTREIARRFNNTFNKNVFQLPEPLLSECPSLIGTDGKNKMSKSLNNAIFLKNSEKELKKKVMSMYTDPNRIHPTDLGNPDKNPIFIYHKLFNPNTNEVKDMEDRYRKGKIGDVEVKEKLFVALNNMLEPIREKRNKLIQDKSFINDILSEGNKRARIVVAETLEKVKTAMCVNYNFKRGS